MPPNVLRKGRSLGTMAMASRDEKRFDGDSSSDDEPSHSAPDPWFPPPPTAPVRKKVPVRDGAPRPLERMPPLVIPPPPPVPDDPISPMPPTPPVKSPLLERFNIKRKTIMEHIEGWWDLGLLEKRRTLYGKNDASSAQRI
jgi:hypothetical protein